MNPIQYELQRDGEICQTIPIPQGIFAGSGVVEKCQAEWLARVHQETLIGVFESKQGIERRILYRP